MNETLAIEAIRKTVTVDCVLEEAFHIFTAEVGSWWPTATHSLAGEKVREVVFEERAGGEVYELAEDGEKGRWATVVAWEPPNRVVLAWEVSPKTLGTEVEIRFSPEGESTRVELEHRGWENASEITERAGYDTGWDFVLGRYVERAR
jgi:hypothetical protein